METQVNNIRSKIIDFLKEWSRFLYICKDITCTCLLKLYEKLERSNNENNNDRISRDNEIISCNNKIESRKNEIRSNK